MSNLNVAEANEENVAKLFGQIGVIKEDKHSRDGGLKMKFYGNGDCCITYEDCHTAPFAIEWFDGFEFLGQKIKVQMAQPPKSKEQYMAERGARGGGGGFRGGREHRGRY